MGAPTEDIVFGPHYKYIGIDDPLQIDDPAAYAEKKAKAEGTKPTQLPYEPQKPTQLPHEPAKPGFEFKPSSDPRPEPHPTPKPDPHPKPEDDEKAKKTVIQDEKDAEARYKAKTSEKKV